MERILLAWYSVPESVMGRWSRASSIPSFPSISPRTVCISSPPPPLDIAPPVPSTPQPTSHMHVPHPILTSLPPLPTPPPQLSPPQTLFLPCPTPAGLSEQEPLHLHFSGHCLANGLLICSIVPCEANSISASQSSLPVDSVIDWRNSCHRPAACSLPPSPQVPATPPPRAAAPRPQRQRTPATCPRICRQQ